MKWCGETAFTGDSGSDVLAAILKQEAPSLSRYSRDIPPELEWIVSKALEKTRDARFQKADEMLSALKRLKQQLEFRAEQERSGERTISDSQEELAAGDGAKESRRRRSYDTNRLRRFAHGSYFEYVFSKARDIAERRRSSRRLHGGCRCGRILLEGTSSDSPRFNRRHTLVSLNRTRQRRR